MIRLLKKYQKVVFAFVAFSTIASLCFFGAYTYVISEKEEKGYIIDYCVDGVPISSLDMECVQKLLFTESSTPSSSPLCDNEFFQKEIIQNGLAELIVEKIFNHQCVEELQKKIQNFQNFSCYTHPFHPQISFEYVLEKCAPHYHKHLKEFYQTPHTEIKQQCRVLIDLYSDQSSFPPDQIKQILLQLEDQCAHFVHRDPRLLHVDLSLFHAKNIADWFGQHFVNELSRALIHGGFLAKKLGYAISTKKVKKYCKTKLHKHLQLHDAHQKISSSQLEQIYQQQLQALHIKESRFIKIMQLLLSWKELFDSIGDNLFVDSPLYRDIAHFTTKKIEVEKYKLPKEFQFHSVEDFLKLEIYLNAISQKEKYRHLPLSSRHFSPVSTIQQKYPFLLEKKFLLQIAHITKREVLECIGLKKVWQWKLQSENWKILSQHFPEIAQCQGSVVSEECLDQLNKLPKQTKEKIDLFIRNHILHANPSFIKERLKKVIPNSKVLHINISTNEQQILPGITDAHKILELLEQYPLEEAIHKNQDIIDDTFSCYSQNEEDFYKIQILDKSRNYEIITFQQAIKTGMLDSLVKETLSKWNTNKERVDNHGASTKIIEILTKEFPMTTITTNHIWNAKHVSRLSVMMEEFLCNQGEGSIEENFFQEDFNNNQRENHLQLQMPLEKQWCPIKEIECIHKEKQHPFFSFEELIYTPEKGSWSKMIFTDEGPLFFYVRPLHVESSEITEQMKKGRSILGEEAKRHLLKSILHKMKMLSSSTMT